MGTLIDSGAQCSSITRGMVEKLGLELKGLETLCLRGWGRVKVGYLGYTKCMLEIPEVKGFKEDVLLLVVNDTEYGDKVPVLLGTLHIDMVLEKVTLEELRQLPAVWRRGAVGSLVLAKQAEQDNSMLNIHSNVKLQKKITIPALGTKKVSGLVNIAHHIKRINVSTKAVPGDHEEKGFEDLDTYATLEGGAIGWPWPFKVLHATD